MLIGAHISAAGGVFNAPINAQQHRAECYQFFSRSPRGGPAPKLTPKILKNFQTNNYKYDYTNYYLHAPYYINLASSNKRIYYTSIEVLKQELKRGTQLKAKAMMFHIGSAKDLGKTQAINQTVKALKTILKNYKGSCQLLIEISAGAGMIIGDTFEEIATIIKKTETIKTRDKLGVCFDTAHAFASGYDLRNKKSVTQTFNKFNRTIGLKRLKIIHANDSKTDFNSRKDRHDHLGHGKIGTLGFQETIKYFKTKKIDVDFIMETPTELGVIKDIKLLKKFRDKK